MLVYGEGKNERETLHSNSIILKNKYIPKHCNLIYVVRFIATKMIFNGPTFLLSPIDNSM